MGKPKQDSQPVISIHDLYPNLKDDELKEAEENLTLYLELALRIYERIHAEPKAYSQFKLLTGSAK